MMDKLGIQDTFKTNKRAAGLSHDSWLQLGQPNTAPGFLVMFMCVLTLS